MKNIFLVLLLFLPLLLQNPGFDFWHNGAPLYWSVDGTVSEGTGLVGSSIIISDGSAIYQLSSSNLVGSYFATMRGECAILGDSFYSPEWDRVYGQYQSFFPDQVYIEGIDGCEVDEIQFYNDGFDRVLPFPYLSLFVLALALLDPVVGAVSALFLLFALISGYQGYVLAFGQNVEVFDVFVVMLAFIPFAMYRRLRRV